MDNTDKKIVKFTGDCCPERENCSVAPICVYGYFGSFDGCPTNYPYAPLYISGRDESYSWCEVKDGKVE